MVARLPSWTRCGTASNPDRATDLVVVLFGHDVFTGLVTQAGWSVPEYKAWLLTTLAQQLLQRPKLTRTAYADLSYSHQMAEAAHSTQGRHDGRLAAKRRTTSGQSGE